MSRKPKKISPFDVALGAVVRSRRTKRGISQTALSQSVGIPLSNYQRREDGSNEFTVSELERIAAVVRRSAAKLVEEALEDYGGIEKLLAEHVSEAPPTVTDELAKKRRSKMTKPLGEDFDETEHQRAATFDTELEQDEPQ